MLANKLNLNVPDILAACVLRIEDISIYNDLVPRICPTLQISVPGFNDCVTLTELPKEFILNLTACDLGLQTSDCGTESQDLPDGVYTVKYSQSPNEKVYVEYDHLRVTLLKRKLKQEWCNLELGACEPSVEIGKKMQQLTLIDSYVEAGKAKVEYCNDVEAGMALYNYANKLLSEYSCKLY
jgi:hypothetical protein